MKLISWWGCGKIDQPLISGDKIVEFGIAGSLGELMDLILLTDESSEKTALI
jgi:hypothetical protein